VPPILFGLARHDSLQQLRQLGDIHPQSGRLEALRKQLQNAGNRSQRHIAEYAELSQRIMQLTAIISNSVKKLPRGTHL